MRTAEGNGPVNALDRALRDAIADMYPRLRDIDLVNYKVRIIDEHKGTGAVTRVLIDASDGDETWGTIGVSENIIEASWEALVDSLEYAMQGRGAARARTPAPASAEPAVTPPAVSAEPIPLARPDVGPREEELVLEVLRSGRLSLGPMLERFEREFAALARRRRRRRGVERHGRAAPRRAGAWAGGAGDEVVTSPFSFVASANCLLYEDVDARLLRHRPAHPEHRPGRPPRPPAATRTAGLLPVHIFGYPADMDGARAARGRPRARRSSRTPARRSARSTPTGVKVGARGNPAAFGFYANKQLATGEGGMLTSPATAAVLRAGRAASATRDAATTWTGSRTTASASTTASPTSRPRSASRSSSALDELLADREPGGRRSTRERLAGIEGLVLPCADAGAERRSWFVYVVQLPAGRRPRRRDRRARRARASPPRPTCRASTCSRSTASGSASAAASSRSPSDVSARSLALPFFTRDDRGAGRAGLRGAPRARRGSGTRGRAVT